MRVLVCGGREFDNLDLFLTSMDDISTRLNFNNKQPITIIEGGARGADFMARCYAKYCGWELKEVKADWKKYGNAAGPLRNQQMLDEEEPDVVIAFPGGNGTRDMIDKARKAGIKVIHCA